MSVTRIKIRVHWLLAYGTQLIVSICCYVQGKVLRDMAATHFLTRLYKETKEVGIREHNKCVCVCVCVCWGGGGGGGGEGGVRVYHSPLIS